MSLKVLTIVGTRPEIIRLSRIINLLDKTTAIKHILVHTGQNYDYELNQIFFEQLELRQPDVFLNAAGKNAIETISQTLMAIDLLLEKEKPDAALLLGDTNSCLCAIAAKKRHIPIFHMEAGNRCFDERVPEEINRKIIDHISDINLPYTDIAREYLIREGFPPDRIIKTGSPMFEVLEHYKKKIYESNILKTLNLDMQNYFVVSIHREENVDNPKNFRDVLDTIKKIASLYKKKIIVSTHPRTRNRLNQLNETFSESILFIKPLGFLDYIYLQINANAVLSDSGTISEESAILNFPALNIRQAHERPEAMEEGAVMMVGLQSERILQAMTLLLHQPKGKERAILLPKDYNVPNVSEKIVRIILSYSDYVKRTVWKKGY